MAAQLYTIREFLKTPEAIEDSLSKVKQIGYDAVQVSGMGPIEPSALHDITSALDLSICATHISFDQLQNHLDDVISSHKLWECRYVGLGSMPDAYRSSADGYAKFVEEFSAIGRRLTAAGLNLVYHNHNFEFEKFGGVPGMQILLDGAGPDTYSMEIDTYWVQAGGGNPTEWIAKANRRIKVVHLKDMAIVGRNQVYAEIGEGNINWDSVLQACRDSGVEYYVIEQDTCTRDPFESLAMSLRYLEKMSS